MEKNREDIRNRTRAAVLEAGKFIKTERENFSHSAVKTKGINDLFSYVDTESEKMLVKSLSELLPGCGFINEESGLTPSQNDFTWIIDPLDGTTNFIQDIPVYCVSVALTEKGEPVLGFVYDVCRNEMFEAEAGAGALLNGREIRVSDKTELKACVMATGFPQKSNYLSPQNQSLNRYMSLMAALFMETRGMRRLGAAAIDLAYTAAGRFDGFFEMHLKPWDVAAGGLIIREAGGIISDFEGHTDYLNDKTSFLAASPAIHRQILDTLK